MAGFSTSATASSLRAQRGSRRGERCPQRGLSPEDNAEEGDRDWTRREPR